MQISSTISTDGMGFVGLINSGNSSNVDNKITDTLFKLYTTAIKGLAAPQGGLYQFAKYNSNLNAIDPAASRQALVDGINSDYKSSSQIDNFADIIHDQIGSAFYPIYTAIKAESDPTAKRTILVNAINDTSAAQTIPNKAFEGVNINTNNSVYAFQINNVNGTLFPSDSDNIGTKAAAMQINLGDLGSNSEDNYANIETHLKNTFGEEIFYNLLIQAAANTTIQSQAIQAAINSGAKINVYDRR
jgi:hypothetical protein